MKARILQVEFTRMALRSNNGIPVDLISEMLLELPEGTKLIGFAENTWSDVIAMRFEHPQFKAIDEGQEIPKVTANFIQTISGLQFINFSDNFYKECLEPEPSLDNMVQVTEFWDKNKGTHTISYNGEKTKMLGSTQSLGISNIDIENRIISIQKTSYEQNHASWESLVIREIEKIFDTDMKYQDSWQLDENTFNSVMDDAFETGWRDGRVNGNPRWQDKKPDYTGDLTFENAGIIKRRNGYVLPTDSDYIKYINKAVDESYKSMVAYGTGFWKCSPESVVNQMSSDQPVNHVKKIVDKLEDMGKTPTSDQMTTLEAYQSAINAIHSKIIKSQEEMSKPLQLEKKVCESHEWKLYQGLNSPYEFCIHCDNKRELSDS